MRRLYRALTLMSVFMLILLMVGCGGKESANDVTGDTGDTEQEQTLETEEDVNVNGDDNESEGSVDVVEENFVGNWTDYNGSTATLSIYSMRGNYYADITWSDGGGEEDTWTMECSFDDTTGKLVYENGIKSRNVTEGNGNMEGESVYEDGTGSFTYSDGSVYWHDDKEDAGKDFEFRQ